MENICGYNFRENVHHGLTHAIDLLFRAKTLAAQIDKVNQMDWKVIAASILIHDVFAYRSEFHGQEAIEFIEKEFTDYTIFNHEQIEKIKQAVAFHDRKLSIDTEQSIEINLETKILYDVDNLDAFGIKGIYRYFCAHIERGIFRQTTDQEILNFIKSRVSDNVQKRRQNLYFVQSRDIADNDFSLTKMFFDKLRQEDYALGTYKGATGVFSFIRENFDQDPCAIAVKVQDYFSRFNPKELNDQERTFTQVFFSRLSEIYSNSTIKKHSLDGFLEFLKYRELQYILSFIEKNRTFSNP